MSSIVRIATLGTEPLSLDYMKNALRIPLTVTNDDPKIKRLMRAAREHCEVVSGSTLVRQRFVQYHDYFPGHRWSPSRDGAYGQAGYLSDQWGGVLEATGLDFYHRGRNEIKLLRSPLVAIESLTYVDANGQPHALKPGVDFIVDVAHQPARLRPAPNTSWPAAMHTFNAVAIRLVAGYSQPVDLDAGQTPAIAEPETSSSATPLGWQPGTVQVQYTFLVDPNGNVEVQMNFGTGSTSSVSDVEPVWAAVGATVVDGDCLWRNCGPVRGSWAPNTKYLVAGDSQSLGVQNQYVILDGNGYLQLLIADSLVSQQNEPTWSDTLGSVTSDNGVLAWRCLGLYAAQGNLTAGEQQAAYAIDYSLPSQAPLAIEYLVQHWYYNRELVTQGAAGEIQHTLQALLRDVTIYDYDPTP